MGSRGGNEPLVLVQFRVSGVLVVAAAMHVVAGIFAAWFLVTCCGPDIHGADRVASAVALPLWVLVAVGIVVVDRWSFRPLALALPILWLGTLTALFALGVYNVAY
jgi:hypothetical protein